MKQSGFLSTGGRRDDELVPYTGSAELIISSLPQGVTPFVVDHRLLHTVVGEERIFVGFCNVDTMRARDMVEHARIAFETKQFDGRAWCYPVEGREVMEIRFRLRHCNVRSTPDTDSYQQRGALMTYSLENWRGGAYTTVVRSRGTKSFTLPFNDPHFAQIKELDTCAHILRLLEDHTTRA